MKPASEILGALPAGWSEYRPPFAPHVYGRAAPREMGPSGLPDPQKIETCCETCGERWQTMCSTGAARSHVSRFGALHAHRDAFKDPLPTR